MGKFRSGRTDTELIISKIKKNETDIYGLSFMPDLEPYWSVEDNWLEPPFGKKPNVHFTPLNHKVLEDEIIKQDNPKVILEIGVDSRSGISSTKTILRVKKDNTKYIGIDLLDRTYLEEEGENIYTISSSLEDYESVEDKLKEIGETEIDLMFADGPKTMTSLLNEWKYWKYMKPNGVMVIHDTNYHPNTVALIEAIDRDIFDVQIYGRDEKDYGISVVTRKQ